MMMNLTADNKSTKWKAKRRKNVFSISPSLDNWSKNLLMVPPLFHLKLEIAKNIRFIGLESPDHNLQDENENVFKGI